MFVRLLLGYKGLKPLPWRTPCPASHPKPAHRDSSGGFEHQRGEAAGTVCLHGQRPRGNTWISCCSPDGGAPSSPIPLKQLKNCVEKEKPNRWEPFPDTAAALLHPQLLGGKRQPNLLGWGLQLLPWHRMSVGLPAFSLFLFILSEPVTNAIKPKKNAN